MKNSPWRLLLDEISTILQNTANQIFPGTFKVTIDNMNNHPDKKVPILDLKIWIDCDNHIHHKFYSKPMAYKGLVWASSGLSKNIIHNIVQNEGLRRLKSKFLK